MTVITGGIKYLSWTGTEHTGLTWICLLQGLINNLEKGIFLPNDSVYFNSNLHHGVAITLYLQIRCVRGRERNRGKNKSSEAFITARHIMNTNNLTLEPNHVMARGPTAIQK